MFALLVGCSTHIAVKFMDRFLCLQVKRMAGMSFIAHLRLGLCLRGLAERLRCAWASDAQLSGDGRAGKPQPRGAY